jgi:Mlc titration factor MtfA (ptsG expression regulator)
VSGEQTEVRTRERLPLFSFPWFSGAFIGAWVGLLLGIAVERAFGVQCLPAGRAILAGVISGVAVGFAAGILAPRVARGGGAIALGTGAALLFLVGARGFSAGACTWPEISTVLLAGALPLLGLVAALPIYRAGVPLRNRLAREDAERAADASSAASDDRAGGDATDAEGDAADAAGLDDAGDTPLDELIDWLHEKMHGSPEISDERRELMEAPFPPEWTRIIDTNVALVRRLTADERRTLERLVQVFLAEKSFEGAGGMELDDEVRVTIAAQACLLTLHLRDPFYSRLRSIVVYPHTYVPQTTASVHSMTLQPEEETPRLGESWQHGAVVLSWDSARRDVADFHDGKNVVLHEFAHQLDQEHEGADGVPVLPNSSAYRGMGPGHARGLPGAARGGGGRRADGDEPLRRHQPGGVLRRRHRMLLREGQGAAAQASGAVRGTQRVLWTGPCGRGSGA